MMANNFPESVTLSYHLIGEDDDKVVHPDAREIHQMKLFPLGDWCCFESWILEEEQDGEPYPVVCIMPEHRISEEFHLSLNELFDYECEEGASSRYQRQKLISWLEQKAALLREAIQRDEELIARKRGNKC